MAKTAAELEEDLTELLHACGLAARGLFREMRLLIDKETRRLRGTNAPNARPGHLLLNGRPMSGVQLANLAGCTHDEVSRLLAELEAAGTVDHDARGTIILPQVTRIGEKLRVRADAQRKSAARSAGEEDVHVGARVSDDTPSDTHLTSVVKSTPPPPGFPPRTPLPTPTPEIPVSTKPGDAAGQAGNAAAGVPAKRKPSGRKRALTDAQLSARDLFTAWYCDHAWPQRHEGLAYPFDGSRDAAAVMKLLKYPHVSWDVDRAKQVATTYLDVSVVLLRPDLQGRPIWGIGQNLSRWTVDTQKRLKGLPYANQNQPARRHAAATGDVPDFGDDHPANAR